MTAQQFIPMFVGLVVLFGLFIWVVGRKLYERVPQRWFLVGVLILIGGIVAGVVLMFQPFVFSVFPVGFLVVLASLIGFMVWSHVQPKTRKQGPSATLEENAPGPES